METCGTIFSRKDFIDDSGCLKPNGHNDFHVCRTESGELMAWQDDEDCTCGCWDDEDDLNNVCKVYWRVESI